MHKYPYKDTDESFFEKLEKLFAKRWARLWMRFGGYSKGGRFAFQLASLFVPPYKERIRLAFANKKGFIEHSAIVHHPQLHMGDHCFIGDRVVIYERRGGGPVTFGKQVEVNRDTLIETGDNGSIEIGDYSSIHPGCVLFSYIEPIVIGSGVMIAANCSFYSYDHGVAAHDVIRNQDCVSKGAIAIGDESWLGVGCIVLSGVTIGKGAVIGAGSVVTHDVPEGAIAVGTPARVVKMRDDL